MKPRFLWLLALAVLPVANVDVRAQDIAGGTAVVRASAVYEPIESYLRTGNLPTTLAQPVTIRVDDQPLERVLEQIVEQAGLQISYTDEIVRSRIRVSMTVQAKSAAAALVEAVRGTGWAVLSARDGRVTVLRREPPATRNHGDDVTEPGARQQPSPVDRDSAHPQPPIT